METYSSKILAESRVKAVIPTEMQVGAACLSQDIVPVKAPFPMPSFKKPEFPRLTVAITEYGAAEQTMATRQIQTAIDMVSHQGGGAVIVPAGVWLTGRIILKSNVNLHIAEGANVHFSGDIEDFRPAVFTRTEGVEVMSLGALVYAHGETNIAVTGKGKLVGPPRDCAVIKQVMNSCVVEKFMSADTPVVERVYEGYSDGPIFLPMFISPVNCKDVYIEGVTLENSPFWNIAPVYCDGVIIRGVTVNSVAIPRGDGIDLDSSRNVLIEYCTLSCGDDCIIMKSGRGEDGLRVNKATENVVVRYCLAKHGYGGMTLGSETAGMIRNIYVHDCVFYRNNAGLQFKTRRPRGGGGENIVLERIRMDRCHTAIAADMLGSRKYVGDLADRLPVRPVNRLVPRYDNVTVRDLIVHENGQFIRIIGIPESPFSNFTLENAEVTSERILQISDAMDVAFNNVSIKSNDSVVALLDARGVVFEDVSFTVPEGELVKTFRGDATADIQFLDCTTERMQDLE